MYAHSSTVLHANRCYVNPDFQHSSTAIHTSLAEAQAGKSTYGKGLKRHLEESNDAPNCQFDSSLCPI